MSMKFLRTKKNQPLWSKEEAENLKKTIEAAGAEVELK